MQNDHKKTKLQWAAQDYKDTQNNHKEAMSNYKNMYKTIKRHKITKKIWKRPQKNTKQPKKCKTNTIRCTILQKDANQPQRNAKQKQEAQDYKKTQNDHKKSKTTTVSSTRHKETKMTKKTCKTTIMRCTTLQKYTEWPQKSKTRCKRLPKDAKLQQCNAQDYKKMQNNHTEMQSHHNEAMRVVIQIAAIYWYYFININFLHWIMNKHCNYYQCTIYSFQEPGLWVWTHFYSFYKCAPLLKNCAPVCSPIQKFLNSEVFIKQMSFQIKVPCLFLLVVGKYTNLHQWSRCCFLQTSVSFTLWL